MLATIMQALDTTIANVALPYMQSSLSAAQDQINLVLTSYIVASAVMMPATGWLSARLGRKRLFIISVVGFTIASVLCGLAGSLGQMVGFRLLQGVFGSTLVPLSQAVLLDEYPREKHGSAMALWGVGVMVGPILGPTLGGWLTETYNWRWVFYINVPVGILTVIGLSVYLHASKPQRGLYFDWFGFLSLTLAIGSMQMMLDRGEQLEWFDSPEIMAEAALAGLGAYLFLVHSLTTDRPFLDPRLFRDRNFVTGLFFIFVVGVILLATLALLTPFLQTLLNYPVLTAGLLLAPRGMGTMAAMMIVGRLVTRVDPRWLVAVGLSLTVFALWQMSQFSTDVTQRMIVVSGITQGLGLGFLFVPLSTMTFATLPADLRTSGTGLYSLSRNLGSSFGISIVVYLLGQFSSRSHAQLSEYIQPYRLPLQQLPAQLDLSNGTGRALVDMLVSQQAAMQAYIADFRVMLVFALGALPLVLVMRRPRRHATRDQEVEAAIE
jgi:DHA2 family multidrug resistance protein